MRADEWMKWVDLGIGVVLKVRNASTGGEQLVARNRPLENTSGDRRVPGDREPFITNTVIRIADRIVGTICITKCLHAC